MSVPKFLVQVLLAGDLRVVASWQAASYTLWEARNKAVFEG